MLYPQEVIEEVRASNDILSLISSYVSLKQKGSYYFGLCPFHNESSPSFSVSPDKQMYYCFGCGASGNAISFVMAHENLDFISALKFLADRVNYTLPEGEITPEMKDKIKLKETLYDIHVIAARFFYQNLTSDIGKKANEYLDVRKLNKNIRIKFGLGYAGSGSVLYNHLTKNGFTKEDILKSGLVLESKKNVGKYYDRFFGRLIFPILDVTGKVIGFGGRSIDDLKPKYLNSPDTIIFDKSKNLYGLNFSRKTTAKEIILVEGYMDVIALFQGGFNNAVASLGTAFNIEHARLLKKYTDTVVLMFDSDEAGTNAILRAIPILAKQGLNIKVLQLSGAKDPDEYLLKYGSEKLMKEINNSDNHIAYQVNLLRKKFDLSKTEEKVKFTYEISKILSSLNNNVLIDAYTDEVSKMTNISVPSIKKYIDNLIDEPVKNITPVEKKNLHYKENYKLNEKGLIEGKKSIVYIICNDYNVYLKVKDVFNPEELKDGIFVKLLKIIYELHEKNQKIIPAELVNYFETVDEQRMVSNIFNTAINFSDIASLEKAVNDQIKIIKKYNLDIDKENMVRENNIAAIQEIAKKERELRFLNITLN